MLNYWDVGSYPLIPLQDLLEFHPIRLVIPNILLEQLIEVQHIDAGTSWHAIEDESWLKSSQSGFSERSI